MTERKAARPAKSPARRTKYELKTKATGASVGAFIAAVPSETRRRDAKTLLALMKKLTGEKPKMWGPSIIGFGSWRYEYDSGHSGEMCMAGFSPRASSLVVYVAPAVLQNKEQLAQLGKHKHGKSCLYINKLADVDPSTLEAIIVASIAEARKTSAR